MKKLYIAFISCFILGSCNNFDEDININPNQPSVASDYQLINSAALSLSGLSSTPGGEFLGQYLAETQYVTASLYPVTSTSFYWIYEGPLNDLQTVIDNSESNNALAIAKILKAYYFWHITDRWGDVPFTEALKGSDDFTPVYDTQEFIYNDIFAQLKEAVAQMDDGVVGDDIMYGGDLDKWKRFANTVRMLMALRISEVDPDKGSTELNDAVTSGIMESNDDSFVFYHLADANNQNYWFGQIATEGGQGREWWALTTTLTEKMKPFDDPRLSVYGNPARANDEYVGLELGETENFDTENFSLLGDAIWQQDAPVYLVTYAEALFAKAEAAKRGWVSGGDAEAQADYEMGIEQSLVQWTGNADGADDYIIQPGVAYTPADAMELIGTQRWIHLFMHGYEGWAEWRRTGYPDNFVEPGGHAIPTRQIYIETEQFNNTENYNAAVQTQFGGEDGLEGKVWWDK